MKRPVAWVAAIATLLATLIASGCETIDKCAGIACGPCQSPIVLTLRAQDNSKLGHATVSGTLQATCNTFETISTCMIGDSTSLPGSYTMTVVVDGYEHAEVTVTVAKDPRADNPDVCCACGYKTARKTVTLKPAK